MGPLVNGTGNLMMQDMTRAKACNAIFTLVFPVNTGLRESQVQARGQLWIKENFLLTEDGQVRGKFKQTVHAQVDRT